MELGQVYSLGGRHRLMCGDATIRADVDRLIEGFEIDIVYTDPPYGIDVKTNRDFRSKTRLAKGNNFPKIIGDRDIGTAIEFYEIADSLTKIICYWGGNHFAHILPPSQCWIVWDKRVTEKQRDKNSDCELAYVKHPIKKSVRIFRHLWKGMIKASECGVKRIHPTQKPIVLAEWVLNELAPGAITVLDVFGGSGSTLIACEKTNRRCFMMEKDPVYCNEILKRWEAFTGETSSLISGEPSGAQPSRGQLSLGFDKSIR